MAARNTVRTKTILLTVQDLVADFLNDDRRDDEELPIGAIEMALANGEITVDEIVRVFRAELETWL